MNALLGRLARPNSALNAVPRLLRVRWRRAPAVRFPHWSGVCSASVGRPRWEHLPHACATASRLCQGLCWSLPSTHDSRQQLDRHLMHPQQTLALVALAWRLCRVDWAAIIAADSGAAFIALRIPRDRSRLEVPSAHGGAGAWTRLRCASTSRSDVNAFGVLPSADNCTTCCQLPRAGARPRPTPSRAGCRHCHVRGECGEFCKLQDIDVSRKNLLHIFSR